MMTEEALHRGVRLMANREAHVLRRRCTHDPRRLMGRFGGLGSNDEDGMQGTCL